MFWVVVIAVIVLIVLFKKGVFRKQGECQHCGKTLKGTEQQVFKSVPFILCGECANRIHSDLLEYAKSNWSYSDYTDYLTWEKETKEERSQFAPDAEYGDVWKLKVDTERGLFSLDSGIVEGLVFRFADLVDYQLDFAPEEIKEGVFGDKVKGNEYVTVKMAAPNIFFTRVMKYDVKLKLRIKGFLNTKYEYELSDGFMEVIRAFTICAYIEDERRNGAMQEEAINIGEVEKALALFMFDTIDEVSEEQLKKQRNALIKAFHPDNNEQNEAYSQKINAAYDLLSSMIKK
ncbi:MAG: hypothetical protein ACI4S2_05975 [Lachnospiraceae bacterium]